MTPDELKRFHMVEEIFYAAMDTAPGAERDELVSKLAGGDAELSAEAARLLGDHERIRAATPRAPSERLPRFGPWQVIRPLGHGGMGSVYLAERADGAFQMQAAVKLIGLPLETEEFRERFRRERQILAKLNHPEYHASARRRHHR